MAAAINANRYLVDQTLTTLTTKITDIDRDDRGMFVRLQETLFHPQGGGQKSDIGFIGTVPVTLALKEGTNEAFSVKHYIGGDVKSLAQGMNVTIEINEVVRELHRRMHSGGHLLASVVLVEYPQLLVHRTQHFPGNAYMAFKSIQPDHPLPEPSIIKTFLEERLPIAVQEDRNVTMNIDGSNRTITIEGYETVGCGGTHVAKTSEIGAITIGKVTAKRGTLTVRYDIPGE